MNLEFLNVTMKNHSEDFTSLPHTLECGRQVQTLEKKSPCCQNIIEGRVCVLRPMGYVVSKTSVTTNSLLKLTPIAASCHVCLKQNCPGEETSLRV